HVVQCRAKLGEAVEGAVDSRGADPAEEGQRILEAFAAVETFLQAHGQLLPRLKMRAVRGACCRGWLRSRPAAERASSGMGGAKAGAVLERTAGVAWLTAGGTPVSSGST